METYSFELAHPNIYPWVFINCINKHCKKKIMKYICKWVACVQSHMMIYLRIHVYVGVSLSSQL